jgi:hypothetical protein
MPEHFLLHSRVLREFQQFSDMIIFFAQKENVHLYTKEVFPDGNPQFMGVSENHEKTMEQIIFTNNRYIIKLKQI